MRRRLVCMVIAAMVASGCSGDAAMADRAEPDAAQAPLSAQAMRDLLERRQECALASFSRQGYSAGDYPRVLIDKVSIDQLYADARAYAPQQLTLFEQINSSSTEQARLENSIHAIGEAAASSDDGADAQLDAMALHAYYESRITGQDCPVDPRILHLVNK